MAYKFQFGDTKLSGSTTFEEALVGESSISGSGRISGKELILDAVGVIEGKTALWDYKKVNRRKTKSQMKKYFMQSVAYTDAHDWMYDTKIEQISILQIFGKTADEMGSEITTLDEDDLNEARENFRDYLEKYNKIV